MSDKIEMSTFHKYTKIKLIGARENEGILDDADDELVMQEKIDGANHRVLISNGQLIFGSRNQEIDEEGDHDFKRCVKFIKEKLPEDSIHMKNYDGCTLYGECCVSHSLSYDWDIIPPFLGFDVMTDDGEYLPHADEIFAELGLPFVPVLWEGKASELPEISEASIPKSVYADSQAEGVVIKNYSKQLFAKYVTTKFKEVNRKAFGGSGPKTSNGDTERIVDKYCTNPRIDKQIFSRIHNGQPLDMVLMKDLPVAVWVDIIEEHGADMLNSRIVIDVPNVRKKIAARCLCVLKQMIINNGLNGDSNG